MRTLERKRKRIYVEYKGKQHELIGVKAMLRPVEGGKLVWAPVKVDNILATIRKSMNK